MIPIKISHCGKCKILAPREVLCSHTTSYYCRSCELERSRKYAATAKGRKVILEASKRAYIKHKKKWQARGKLRYAVMVGKIIKPKNCSMCGEEKPLQGHHTDYEKIYQVQWLCTGCHGTADRKLKSPPQELP